MSAGRGRADDDAPGASSWPSVAALHEALLAYAAFLAAIELLTLALGAATVGMGRAVAIAILIASSGIGALLFRARLAGREAAPSARADRVLVVGGVALAGAGFALWALAWNVPELTCDGNAYHIPPIGLWARRGYVHWIGGPWSGLFDGYPKGIEVLGFVLATATGSSRFVGTYNLVALPLALLSVLALARRLGASPRAALLGAALVLTVPVHLRQAPTAYVDSGFAALCMAFFAAIVLARDGARAPGAGSLRAFVGPGLTAGLALGAKPSALAIVPIGLAALAASVAIGAPRRRLARLVLPGLVLAAGLATVIGGYWYARNLAHTGSPIFPAGLRVAGRVVFPGEPASVVMNEAGTTPPELAAWGWPRQVAFTWIQGATAWPATIDGYESRLGGLGFLWVLGCLPAVAFSAARARRDAARRGPMALLLAIVALSFLAMPMRWWARYTVWIYALGLPCFAVLVDAAFARPAPGARGAARTLRALRVWIALVVVVAAVEARLSVRSLVDAARAPWPYDRLFPEARGTVLEEVLGGRAPVAVGPMTSQLLPSQRWKHNVYGALALPLGARAWVQGADAAALLAQVRGGLRARWVLWDDALPLPEELRGAALRVERAAGFVVLEMRP